MISYYRSTERQNAIGGVYFTKELRTATLQPYRVFDILESWLERGILKHIFYLYRLIFFFGRFSGLFERMER